SVALFTMMMTFGSAWITAVALKNIAAEVGGARSIPAFASSLAWFGSGLGGLMMGRIADRVGTRWTVICGSVMVALGLSISTLGLPWPLWIGHGLFIGLVGLGGINAPLYIYVSRWFDAQAWLGAGVDFERQLSRGLAVAANVRTRHCYP